MRLGLEQGMERYGRNLPAVTSPNVANRTVDIVDDGMQGPLDFWIVNPRCQACDRQRCSRERFDDRGQQLPFHQPLGEI